MKRDNEGARSGQKGEKAIARRLRRRRILGRRFLYCLPRDLELELLLGYLRELIIRGISTRGG